MNVRQQFRFPAACIALALALAACSSPGGTSAAPGGSTTEVPAGSNIVAFLLAGQYNGTIQDSKHGNGKAVLQLTAVAENAGGSLKQTYSATSVQGVVAFTLASTVAPNGSEVTLGSSPCTFSVDAAFNATKHVISGTFKAVNRCSGETGSFKLKQRCYYKMPPTVTGDGERPDTLGVKPC
jgi:hypothetical protein